MLKILKNWLPFGSVDEITSLELNQALKEANHAIQILDVRTPNEWKSGHIASSINVPITKLASSLHKLPLDKTKPVVAICLSAHRSIPAVRLLKDNGYQNVKQLQGGMKAWNKHFQQELQRG